MLIFFEYWEISEYKNKPILVFDDRNQHVIDKHLKDFGSMIVKNYAFFDK